MQITFFIKYFSKGDDRSIKIKKNVISMLFLKGGSILVGLMLVPLTIDYVDSERYGIWLTLSSMVAWIHFFDIGINNGLRNKLGQAFANEDLILAKKYVSTTYALMSLIFLPVMIVLLIVSQYISWNEVLKIASNNENILLAVNILVVYFCINFILSTVNVVMLADQRPADASLRQLIQQLVSLLVVYLMTICTKGSLLNLCIGMCISPLIVLFAFNITLFNRRYRIIAPSFKNIDFNLTPILMRQGIQFFIIQIAGVIQYQMINFLIIRNYGSSEVTAYNIAYRYFSVLMLIWGILTVPIWSAVTDAYTRKDYAWIRRIIYRYVLILGLFYIGGFLMLGFSNFAYHIWIGDKVHVSLSLSVWVMLYNFMMMFCNIFVSITNGCGKLKLQSYACLISPIIFLFCCYYLINIGLGPYSILIAAIICNLNGFVLAPIQCYKIINEKRC